ncbi:MAG: hypothetical protein JOS17DRAFT_382741 [Linnemannia elongata]|nr:MAG: hypothetical protein JOS17DRAFT_382741 [Linnemannia elongata]
MEYIRVGLSLSFVYAYISFFLWSEYVPFVCSCSLFCDLCDQGSIPLALSVGQVQSTFCSFTLSLHPVSHSLSHAHNYSFLLPCNSFGRIACFACFALLCLPSSLPLLLPFLSCRSCA